MRLDQVPESSGSRRLTFGERRRVVKRSLSGGSAQFLSSNECEEILDDIRIPLLNPDYIKELTRGQVNWITGKWT